MLSGSSLTNLVSYFVEIQMFSSIVPVQPLQETFLLKAPFQHQALGPVCIYAPRWNKTHCYLLIDRGIKTFWTVPPRLLTLFEGYIRPARRCFQLALLRCLRSRIL
ncbi:unnamed protein product [Lepidochelys olivacea]